MLPQLNSLLYVVDDDPDLRAIVEEWLTEAGYDVSCFAAGQECLDAIDQEEPQAICLDLNMPGLSGMQVMEQIRLRYPSLPVIMLTADDTATSAVTAMKLGGRFERPSSRRQGISCSRRITRRSNFG